MIPQRLSSLLFLSSCMKKLFFFIVLGSVLLLRLAAGLQCHCNFDSSFGRCHPNNTCSVLLSSAEILQGQYPACVGMKHAKRGFYYLCMSRSRKTQRTCKVFEFRDGSTGPICWCSSRDKCNSPADLDEILLTAENQTDYQPPKIRKNPSSAIALNPTTTSSSSSEGEFSSATHYLENESSSASLTTESPSSSTPPLVITESAIIYPPEIIYDTRGRDAEAEVGTPTPAVVLIDYEDEFDDDTLKMVDETQRTAVVAVVDFPPEQSTTTAATATTTSLRSSTFLPAPGDELLDGGYTTPRRKTTATLNNNNGGRLGSAQPVTRYPRINLQWASWNLNQNQQQQTLNEGQSEDQSGGGGGAGIATLRNRPRPDHHIRPNGGLGNQTNNKGRKRVGVGLSSSSSRRVLRPLATVFPPKPGIWSGRPPPLKSYPQYRKTYPRRRGQSLYPSRGRGQQKQRTTLFGLPHSLTTIDPSTSVVVVDDPHPILDPSTAADQATTTTATTAGRSRTIRFKAYPVATLPPSPLETIYRRKHRPPLLNSKIQKLPPNSLFGANAGDDTKIVPENRPRFQQLPIHPLQKLNPDNHKTADHPPLPDPKTGNTTHSADTSHPISSTDIGSSDAVLDIVEGSGYGSSNNNKNNGATSPSSVDDFDFTFAPARLTAKDSQFSNEQHLTTSTLPGDSATPVPILSHRPSVTYSYDFSFAPTRRRGISSGIGTLPMTSASPISWQTSPPTARMRYPKTLLYSSPTKSGAGDVGGNEGPGRVSAITFPNFIDVRVVVPTAEPSVVVAAIDGTDDGSDDEKDGGSQPAMLLTTIPSTRQYSWVTTASKSDGVSSTLITPLGGRGDPEKNTLFIGKHNEHTEQTEQSHASDIPLLNQDKDQPKSSKSSKFSAIHPTTTQICAIISLLLPSIF